MHPDLQEWFYAVHLSLTQLKGIVQLSDIVPWSIIQSPDTMVVSTGEKKMELSATNLAGNMLDHASGEKGLNEQLGSD